MSRIHEHKKVTQMLKKKNIWKQCNLNHMDVGDAGAKSISVCMPKFTTIQELNLYFNGITDAGLELLKNFDGVTKLDLERNRFSHIGIECLCRSLAGCTSILGLSVSRNNVGPEGLAAISDMLQQNHQLEDLKLRRTHLRLGSFETFADGAKHLRRLDLAENAVGLHGAEALANALPSSALEELILYDASLGSDGAIALSRALVSGRGPKLKKLDLAYNAIDQRGAQAMAEVLQHELCSLEWLSLSRNVIGREGADAVSLSLRVNKVLQELRVGSNSLGVEGLRGFCEALKINATLRHLFLRHNDLGDDGATAFGLAMPDMQGLQYLGLNQNGIGDAGAIALFKGLRTNIRLTGMALEFNSIGNQGAESMARELGRRQDFKHLKIGRNHIEDQGAEALADMLRSHKGLQELELDSNWLGGAGGEFATGGSALANALRENKVLEKLNLSRNRIFTWGAEDLAQAGRGKRALRTLDISGCYFGIQGVVPLAKMLSECPSLEVLDMSENELLDKGTATIAQFLNEKCKLHELRLRSNYVGDQGAEELSCTLACTMLQVVDLDDNTISDVGAEALAKAVENMKALAEFGLLWNPIEERGDKCLKEGAWKNTIKFRKSPPKIRLGSPEPDDEANADGLGNDQQTSFGSVVVAQPEPSPKCVAPRWRGGGTAEGDASQTDAVQHVIQELQHPDPATPIDPTFDGRLTEALHSSTSVHNTADLLPSASSHSRGHREDVETSSMSSYVSSWSWISGGSGSSPKCFVPETLFPLYESGEEVLATDLKEGTLIKASDGDRLEVRKIVKQVAHELIELKWGTDVIVVTPEHVIVVAERRGDVKAKDLRLGQFVKCESGAKQLCSMQALRPNPPQEVFAVRFHPHKPVCVRLKPDRLLTMGQRGGRRGGRERRWGAGPPRAAGIAESLADADWGFPEYPLAS